MAPRLRRRRIAAENVDVPVGPTAAARRLAVRTVLGNANLRWLALSWGGWITGEWAFLVVLSVIAFDVGGAPGVGIAGAVRMIPAAVLSPLGSTIVDRWARSRILVAVHATWAVLLLLLALAVTLGGSLLVVLLITGAAAAAASAFRPAVSALLPQLVDRPQELTAANSVYAGLEASGTLLGPVVAGGLLAALTPGAALVPVAAVFAASALVTVRIRTRFRPSARTGRRVMWLSLLAGFPALVGRAELRPVVGLILAQTVMRGLLNVYVVVAALSLFHTGDAGTAVLFAAVGCGGVLAAVGSLRFAEMRRLTIPVGVGVCLWGLPIAAIAAWPNPVVAAAMLVLVGLGNAIEDVGGLTLMQRLLPPHRIGQAFGAFWGSALVAVAVGSLLAPLLISALGLRGAMGVTGLALAAGVVVTWPALHRADDVVEVPERQLALLHRQPIFAPLPRVAIESVARALSLEDVPAGRTVVCQGEPGDAFYVIDAGEFSVTQNGEPIGTLTEGDFFGEIALLRRVPRTATVAAITNGRVYRLPAAQFVASVTGHTDTAQAATDVVDERLAHDGDDPPDSAPAG